MSTKEIEIYDAAALFAANPNLVQITPDKRKIRTALNLGFDVPGARFVEPAPEAEAAPVEQPVEQPVEHPVAGEQYTPEQPAADNGLPYETTEVAPQDLQA